MASLPRITEAEVNFCPRDGAALEGQVKAGEMRRVCPTCGWIFGRDPRVLVGLLIERDGQALFVRRSAGGREVWSLPIYPLVERDDARQAVAAQLRAEIGLAAQVTGVLDAFLVDDDSIGTALFLLFSGQISQAPDSGRGFAFRTGHQDASLLSTSVTRQALERWRGAETR
jgi:hypothetical protein